MQATAPVSAIYTDPPRNESQSFREYLAEFNPSDEHKYRDFSYSLDNATIALSGFVSRGKESIQEDFFYVCRKGSKIFLLVLDGVSSFHSEMVPNRDYIWQEKEELTTGQIAALTCIKQLIEANSETDPIDILQKAHTALRATWRMFALDTYRPEHVTHLGGVAGVLAMIDTQTLAMDITQWGDVTASIKVGKDIYYTPNQAFRHEIEMQAKQLEIRERNQGKLSWNEFGPFINSARINRVNNPDNPTGYGLLNGQIDTETRSFIRCLNRRKIQLMPGAIFRFDTDGHFEVEDYRNQGILAEKVIQEMKEKPNILDHYKEYLDPHQRQHHHEVGTIWGKVI